MIKKGYIILQPEGRTLSLTTEHIDSLSNNMTQKSLEEHEYPQASVYPQVFTQHQ